MFYDFDLAKKEYRAFCENSGSDIRIFAQPWYLDAVCDSVDDWRVILVKENGRIVAAFPFGYIKDRRGMWHIRNPWQAARLGIWMDYGDRTRSGAREEFENRVIAEIISKLPPYDVFRIAFDERLRNWQQFYRNGFSQTTYYSYILDGKRGADSDILSAMESTKRKKVNHAQKLYSYKTDISIEAYWQFFEKSYGNRKRTAEYKKEEFLKMYCAAEQAGATKIYAAYDCNGKIIGTFYALRDASRWYNMFGTFDAEAKPGAQTWLTYLAAIDAINENKIFDFEGSMIPGVAQFNSEFGAVKEPYFLITKYSDRYALLFYLREAFRAGERMLLGR